WRIQTDPGPVTISLSSGARMDPAADPTLRKKGIQAVRDFCRKTGINLAGFDLIYPEKPPDSPPCFLEINYYFGRRGIGGSERFYALLTWQIRKWIKTLQASMNP
ncbi:MAG: glutathione synthase, partial [Thermodesulfobacteriota bacterium]